MTEKLLGPLRTRPWPERWLTRVLGAALSGAAYLLCLPWDLRNRPGATGSGARGAPAQLRPAPRPPAGARGLGGPAPPPAAPGGGRAAPPASTPGQP
ncbi:hypothetical protein ACFXJB_27865, partial [Streptomyces mirabilis]